MSSHCSFENMTEPAPITEAGGFNIKHRPDR